MKVMYLELLCVTFGLFEYLTCKYRQEKREISQNRVMLCETMIHSLFLNCNFILPTSNKQRQTPPTFCRLLGDFPATEQSAEDLFYQWLKSKNISSGNFLPKKNLPEIVGALTPVSPAPAWHATRLLTFHNVVWSLRRCQRRGSASRQTL